MNTIPEIRKLAKQVLKQNGFQYPSQDGKTLFVYKELDIHRLCFNFTLIDRGNNKFITSSATFISNALGEAMNNVDKKSIEYFLIID